VSLCVGACLSMKFSKLSIEEWRSEFMMLDTFDPLRR
jgi:hypothetical protein